MLPQFILKFIIQSRKLEPKEFIRPPLFTIYLIYPWKTAYSKNITDSNVLHITGQILCIVVLE